MITLAFIIAIESQCIFGLILHIEGLIGFIAEHVGSQYQAKIKYKLSINNSNKNDYYPSSDWVTFVSLWRLLVCNCQSSGLRIMGQQKGGDYLNIGREWMENRISRAIKTNKYYHQVLAQYRELVQQATCNQNKSSPQRRQSYSYHHHTRTFVQEDTGKSDSCQGEDLMGLRKQMQFMCFDISGIKKQRRFDPTPVRNQNENLSPTSYSQHQRNSKELTPLEHS